MDINLFRKSLASKQGLLKEDHAIATAKSLLAKASAALNRNDEDAASAAASHLQAVRSTLKSHPLYGMDLRMKHDPHVHTLQWFVDSAAEVASDALAAFNRGLAKDGQKTLVLCKDEVDDILWALDALF